MNKFIRNAKIVDPGGHHNGQFADIRIVDGVIAEIGQLTPSDSDQLIAEEGLCVFPGFIDTHAFLGEPGYEDRETLETGLEAAARGGFTAICTDPSTMPIVQDRAQVEFLIRTAENSAVDILPLGALSTDLKGEEMAPLLELDEAGAIGFSNGHKPLKNTGTLMRSLQYATHAGKVIYQFADDLSITGGGYVNEGIPSTMLGLKNRPAFAEWMAVERDLHVLRYAGGKMHFPLLSTAKAIEAVRNAKADGLQVSCGINALHLHFTDESLFGFDTNLKVLPPFRGDSDRLALINGVIDGTIDCICSDHQPVDTDHKYCEFDLADFGAINLQTAALTALEQLPTKEAVVNAMAHGPRKVLGLPVQHVEVGYPAVLTLISESKGMQWEKSVNVSVADNSPLFGTKFSHTILGVINQEKTHLYV